MSITAEKVTDRYINLLNKFGEWKRIYEEYERAAQMSC